MAQRANTAYVYWSRLGELAAALQDIFAAEGYARIERPPERNSESDAAGPSSPVWALALLPGKSGWSVLKTIPVNLLCGVSAASGVPRIAELAAILHCPAFQYNVQDESGETLVEADPSGETRRIQTIARAAPAGAGLAASEPQTPVQFQLLRLPALQSILVNQPDPPSRARHLAEALAEPVSMPSKDGQAGSKLEAPWRNEIQSHYLIPHRPLPLPGWIELYFAEVPQDQPASG